MQYLYGRIEPGPHACRLGTLKNVSDTFELLQGVSRQANWPEDAYFEMSQDFKDDIKTEDFISNNKGVLVVSDNVREVTSGIDLINNEWLAIDIFNHKRRKIKARYFILHQTHFVDCIDLQESAYERNPIDEDFFIALSRLVIDPGKPHPDLLLFRMEHYPYPPIFHRTLADKIVAAGCTGICFKEFSEWEDE